MPSIISGNRKQLRNITNSFTELLTAGVGWPGHESKQPFLTRVSGPSSKSRFTQLAVYSMMGTEHAFAQ